MKPASMGTLASLVTLALLLACEGGSGRLPSEPDAGIAAHRARDRSQPRFSDWSAPVNLGPVVNSASTDIEVSISKDGLSLYLASNRPGGFGGFDIWVSRRAGENDPWGTPQNLGPGINTGFNDQAPALTSDGHSLYFFSNRPGGFGGNDIYVSRRSHKRDDFGWEPPVNLGSGVNSAFNDQLPAYFKDGETETVTLFFNSNRPGGPGGTDIYASTLQSDGTFDPAMLVPELNSPLRDAGMAIRRDGLEIVLGSDRPGTLGLFDLWVATRPSTSDPWSAPVNLGAVVNTADDEGRSGLSFDGTTLYIISGRPGGFGNQDLWVSTCGRLSHDHDDEDDGEDDDRRRGRR